MDKNAENAISISEASKDFSKAIDLADKYDAAVITENNKPKYKLINLENDTTIEMTDDEKIDFVAARILKQYRRAFEELAK